MATKYIDVYDAFLNKISDYDLPLMDSDLSDKMLHRYLKNAIARSKRILKHIDFTKTTTIVSEDSHVCQECDTNKGFIDDFTDEDIDVLIEWMVVFWLEPYVNNTDHMRMALNTKDFSSASSANMLAKISDRYELSRKHALSLMNKHSFILSDIERLKP